MLSVHPRLFIGWHICMFYVPCVPMQSIPITVFKYILIGILVLRFSLSGIYLLNSSCEEISLELQKSAEDQSEGFGDDEVLTGPLISESSKESVNSEKIDFTSLNIGHEDHIREISSPPPQFT
jgi:hypothetical protein